MKETEQNKKPNNVKMHDVVMKITRCRTAEDGSKLGYSWYEDKTDMGVVVAISDNTVSYKRADGEVETYDSDREDKDYYYEMAVGSEFEYIRELEKHVERKVTLLKQAERDLDDAHKWLHDYKEKVSLIGRLMRFIKIDKYIQ